jgi:hypothetical protein
MNKDNKQRLFEIIQKIDSSFKNKQYLNENHNNIFYHGSTDKNMKGKNGIHIGTKLAATEALQAKIGVPVKGEWDGTREYGKTLLAGKKTLKEKNFIVAYDPIIFFNAMEDVPEEDYYPTKRKKRAVYSDGTVIPFNSKPIVFKVIIIGEMSNTIDKPYSDSMANGIMNRQLNLENAKRGYYYINTYEDNGSISAVVPNKSFLQIL